MASSLVISGFTARHVCPGATRRRATNGDDGRDPRGHRDTVHNNAFTNWALCASLMLPLHEVRFFTFTFKAANLDS